MWIKTDSILKLEGLNTKIYRKPVELPKKITLNKEVSWMIGIWLGDNYSPRKGTVKRDGFMSSGRFGIINNDKEIISRFKGGLKNEFEINKIKLDILIPRQGKHNKRELITKTLKEFKIKHNNIKLYYSSPWRKNIGYAVYTNNTALLRIIYSHIYKKLIEYIKNNKINTIALMQGIFDSEGHIDKANKIVGVTNKDKYLIQIISICFEKLKIDFHVKVDKRGRTNFEVRDLNKFKEIGFHTSRKMKGLNDMISGNFCREKDKTYLNKFYREFRKGTTAIELCKKSKIPHPTIKVILRNLVSGNYLKTKKSGRAYIYSLPSGCLTKPEAIPKTR